MAEVDLQRGIVQRPAGVGRVAGAMPHVGRGRGVAARQRVFHSLDLEDTTEVRAAGDQQLAVPGGQRHPDFEAHLRLNGAVHPTECRLVPGGRQHLDFLDADGGTDRFAEFQDLQCATGEALSDGRGGRFVCSADGRNDQHEQASRDDAVTVHWQE